MNAQEKLKQREEDLERFERLAQQRAIDVGDAERTLGENVHADTPADQPIGQKTAGAAITKAASNVAQLRAEQEAAEAAVVTAQRKVDEARRAVLVEQADELEDEALGLEEEADELDEQTAPHLAALRKLEGVDYVPSYLVTEAERSSSVMRADRELVRTVTIPKSQHLRKQAAALRAQAAALRTQVANTPEARTEQAAQHRQARREWIQWEQEESQRTHATDGGKFSDYHDLDGITADSRFVRPGPDDAPEERTAYERAVAVRKKLRQEKEAARLAGAERRQKARLR